MSRVIGIEGSSYVGKTTVANRLAEMGYNVIPEYDSFGAFPVSDGTVKGSKAVIDELLGREKRRSELIKANVANFQDRTAISLVTFEEMMMLNAEKDEAMGFRMETRAYVLSRIHELKCAGKITLPDKITVLRLADSSEFQRRVGLRGVTPVAKLALFDVQLYVAERSQIHSGMLIGEGNTSTTDVDSKDTAQIARELLSLLDRQPV